MLKYEGENYSNASLAEPMSCIIGSYHANFRMEAYTYKPLMGIKEGGNLALIAAAGPMGLGAIDYALHCDRKPKLLVVVDINEERLETAKRVLPVEEAEKQGVKLVYINSAELEDPYQTLMDLTDGEGYDDTYAYAPVKSVIALADDILGQNGCMNFFAGPTDTQFKAEINFYKVHYSGTHIIGTTGGSTADMQESLDMTSAGTLNPAVMVTHVGGLDVVPDTVLNLPKIPGGKKLIYPHTDIPLIDIRDFSDLAEKDDRYKELEAILDKTNRIWSLEAEQYVIENFSR